MKRKRAVLLLVLVAVIVAAAVFLPFDQLLMDIQAWAAANPKTAAWGVGAITVIGVVLSLPSSPLMLLSGFLFGLGKGFLVVWLSGMVASTAAFLVGRTAARSWVERKMQNHATFIAIDRAVARKGTLIVLLTRLVMVLPYPPLNYSLGLTGVSLRDYFIGTNLGMIPPMFLVVYLGTTVSSMAAIVQGEISLDGRELAYSAVALAVVVVVIGLIIRVALKTLREELAAAGNGNPGI